MAVQIARVGMEWQEYPLQGFGGQQPDFCGERERERKRRRPEQRFHHKKQLALSVAILVLLALLWLFLVRLLGRAGCASTFVQSFCWTQAQTRTLQTYTRARHRDLRVAEVGGQAVRAQRFWDRFYQSHSVSSASADESVRGIAAATPRQTEWTADVTEFLPLVVGLLNASTPSKIVEIGCGNSALAARLYDELGGNVPVIALDISEVALAGSRQAFGASRPGLQYICADATDLRSLFDDDSVAVVVDKGMADTLQFRARSKESKALRERLFAEVFRVLLPGGLYVMATPKSKPQYMNTVPWASSERIRLQQPKGILFDTSNKGGPEAIVVAQAAYVHVNRKPMLDDMSDVREAWPH